MQKKHSQKMYICVNGFLSNPAASLNRSYMKVHFKHDRLLGFSDTFRHNMNFRPMSELILFACEDGELYADVHS